MNIETYAGISVARYVAMRNLDTSEIDKIVKQVEKNGGNLFERASRVMSRVGFVDKIRYSVPLDLTDHNECIERNALETYLLCTCLDTLASKDDYVEIQNWLKAKKIKPNVDKPIHGFIERNQVIDEIEAGKSLFTKNIFLSTLLKVLEIYNEHYGVNRNIANLIKDLPITAKEKLASAYTIYKESDPNGKDDWEQERNIDSDGKLKKIICDYLFQYRRNLYTHESKRFNSFGGTSVARTLLHKGITDLSPAKTIHLPSEKPIYVVTCHYGDEAEFIREIIISCLANKFDLLHSGWSGVYEKAEKAKRLLYSLFYELKYNIQIMQYYLQVLSEPLIIYNNNNISPKLETKVTQAILSNNQSTLPIDNYFLHSYFEAASQFNNEVEDSSQSVNALIMKSKFHLYSQSLGNQCMQLLENYPTWTYSTNYIPPSSL